MITNASPKMCSLDPTPTSVLKKWSDVIAPLLTHIINNSLSQGTMPSSLKQAIVSPLLKNPR